MHSNLIKIPYFNELKKIILEGGFDSYFVGGCVRDIILDRPVHDVDLVCFSHDYKYFAKAIKDRLPSVWVEFKDNIRLVRGRVEIDISKPRGKTLDEDLSKRDFTINNLAMNTAGDIFGCKLDLDAKVVRHVSENTFIDDPLRILRTFRFQAQLGFSIAPATIERIRKDCDLICNSASERVFAELDKLFEGGYAYDAMHAMIETGVCDVITGGVKPSSVDEEAAKLGRGLVFFASSIFCSLGKDERESFAKRLNFPNAMTKRAMRTAELTEKLCEVLRNTDNFALRRLIFSYPDELDDGVKLYELQCRCSDSPEVLVEADVDRVMSQLIYVDFETADRLNGVVLQEIGVAPGPVMGEIIRKVRPMLASGELADLEAGLKYIQDNFKR